MKSIKIVLVAFITLYAAVASAELYEGQSEVTVYDANRYELWAPNSMVVHCRPGDLFYINATVKNAPKNTDAWLEINGERVSQDGTSKTPGKIANQSAWVADGTEFSVVHFVMHNNNKPQDFDGCQLVVVPVRR